MDEEFDKDLDLEGILENGTPEFNLDFEQLATGNVPTKALERASEFATDLHLLGSLAMYIATDEKRTMDYLEFVAEKNGTENEVPVETAQQMIEGSVQHAVAIKNLLEKVVYRIMQMKLFVKDN